MATPFPEDDRLLAGPFKPIGIECDCADLVVEGAVPEGLEGTLYRVGPNPQYAPIAPYNPLQGDGMVHAFRIANGRVSYRNRWVRTRRWALERQAGRALFSTVSPRLDDPSVRGVDGQGAANTHIVAHGGRLLALEEGHAPIEIDPDSLDTRGPWKFGGRLAGAMTAHPKIDARTGEMFFFSNGPNGVFDGSLAVYAADRSGKITSERVIRAPYPALVHDFGITANSVVFVVCPLVLSIERARAGGSPIAWEPERSSFIGLIPRDSPAGEVRWLPGPTGMVWHLLNAFEVDGKVQIDLCQQAAAAFPQVSGECAPESALRQFLTRWTVDPKSNESVIVSALSEVVCEYPRIDDRLCGLEYRYGFVAALGGPGTGDLVHRALGRYDYMTGEMRLWRAEEGQSVSEPVFVPRGPTSEEGAGWLLATVFDSRRNASHLVVIDAERVEDGPIMKALLDHRIPAGFHGSFVLLSPSQPPGFS